MAHAIPTTPSTVALFNASDDTVDMVQKLLTDSHSGQAMIWCHFAALKKGTIDFRRYLAEHDPEVVIVDLSPPYGENWEFFKVMRDDASMSHRGIVLTTTNKDRLDEVLREDSHALEVVGRAEDLALIGAAILDATASAKLLRPVASV